MYRKYSTTTEIKVKTHLKFLLITFISGVLPPVIVSMTLPHFGIFGYDWLGQASGLIWFLFISYSITRHNLFNIRVIATQLGVYALWVCIAIRTIMATSEHEMLINASFLATTIILGVLLIRNTLNSMNQENQIHDLTTKLNEANTHIQELNKKNMV